MKCLRCETLQEEITVLRDEVRRLREPALPFAANVHRNDPETSHQAADSIEKKRQKDCWRVLALIRSHPGHSVSELHEILDPPLPCDVSGSSVGKRVSDLIAAGWVVYDGQKKNPKTGRQVGLVRAKTPKETQGLGLEITDGG